MKWHLHCQEPLLQSCLYHLAIVIQLVQIQARQFPAFAVLYFAVDSNIIINQQVTIKSPITYNVSCNCFKTWVLLVLSGNKMGWSDGWRISGEGGRD